MEIDSRIGKWFYIFHEDSKNLFFRCSYIEIVSGFGPVLHSKYWITKEGLLRTSGIDVCMAELNSKHIIECTFTDVLEYFLEGTTPPLLT